MTKESNESVRTERNESNQSGSPEPKGKGLIITVASGLFALATLGVAHYADFVNVYHLLGFGEQKSATEMVEDLPEEIPIEKDGGE